MQREAKKLLFDIQDAAGFILDVTHDMDLDAYRADRLVRDAVERNFITIGEAISRLDRIDPPTARAIANHPQVIGFRNRVVHGYDVIDHAVVWGVIQGDLASLKRQVDDLLSLG
jgi:uncharacterized protein with HEPN domain